jgi:hypothetical protein
MSAFIGPALLLMLTWFAPAAGVATQILWLLWVLITPSPHARLIWVTGATLVLVQILSEFRMEGPEALIGLLDLPYSLVSLAIAYRYRKLVPWWVSLPFTAPIVAFLIVLLGLQLLHSFLEPLIKRAIL